MATVSDTIRLNDQYTPVLSKIIRALQNTTTVLAGVDRVSSTALDSIKVDVNEATLALDQMNNELDQLPPAANTAAKSFTRFSNPLVTAGAAIYAIRTGFMMLGKITSLADNFTSTNARLNMINDGLQTTAQLQQMIFESAERSTSSFVDSAAAVSKLGMMAGDAFKNTEEIVAFSELMNKSFKTGGAGLQEQKSAMYQLTQAMASGKLQGDEFRSIMENAPMLAAAIAKYVGVSKGELKKVASEGLITSDMIKGAMFSAADEINAKFKNMPKTFGATMQSIQNQALMAMQPIFIKLSALLAGVNFQRFLGGFLNVMTQAANTAAVFIDMMLKGADWIMSNWDWISPIIWGVVAAMIAFNVVTAISTFLYGLKINAARLDAITLGIQAGATFIATVAQYGLNTAMYLFPGAWLIGAVVAIIAIFIVFGLWLYNLWQKNMEFKYGVLGIWEDIMYGIAGVFSVIQLMGAGVANSIELALANVVVSVQNKINDVIELINKVIQASNALTGAKTQLWNKLTFGDTYKGQVDANVAERNAAVNNKIQQDATNHLNNEAALSAAKQKDLEKIAAKKAKKPEDKGFDYGKYMEGINIKGGNLDSVGSIKNDITISDEDIKMLKDVAAAEFVNKYTTLRPEMKVSFGDVRESADVNQIMSTLETMFENAYASSLVGG